MNLTTEQQDVIQAVAETRDSLLVSACAGSGKTTTLKLASQKAPVVPSLALAFNKRNQVDLDKAMPGHINCKTFNALGHAAWSKAIGRRRMMLNDRKIGELTSQVTKEADLQPYWGDILKLVNAARGSGLILEDGIATWGYEETPDAWEDLAAEFDTEFGDEILWATRQVLKASIQEAYQGVIDFGDQIYMPLTHNGVFGKFDTVLVDEAQDLSPMNQEALRRSMRPSSRLIAVGDRAQAIYGFRGADTRSMDTLKEDFNMHELELSVTFRCPTSVVEVARQRLPQMQPMEGAPEGKVNKHVGEFDESLFPKECAILCRNNAPLTGIGFKLIRRGRGVNFIGGDLGRGLTRILKKVGDDDTPSAEALEAIDKWENTEVTKAAENNRPERIGRIKDKAECLRAAFHFGEARTVGEAKDYLQHLFDESNGTIYLSTGHRCKGFEWDHVFFLDPWRIPTKFARQARDQGNPEPLQQENNLRYVIVTRAKQSLTYINLKEFNGQGSSHD